MVRTRKPAPPKPVEFTEPVEVPEVTDPVNSDETEKPKRGRKASPLTAAIREWEQAKHKAAQAQKRFDKVKDVQDGLDEAKAAEQAAYDRLQQLLKDQGAMA